MSTRDRGFAHMDEKKQRDIASKGGKASQASGHAHHFSSEEAQSAGKSGGQTTSSDKQHMSEIGSKGGKH